MFERLEKKGLLSASPASVLKMEMTPEESEHHHKKVF